MTAKEIRRLKDSLPRYDEMNEQEEQLDLELDCRNMINSILIYGGLDKDIETIYNDKYLRSYRADIEKERLKQLIKEQQDDLKKSEVELDVYTDNEGVSYNSVIWYDEINAKKEDKNESKLLQEVEDDQYYIDSLNELKSQYKHGYEEDDKEIEHEIIRKEESKTEKVNILRNKLESVLRDVMTSSDFGFDLEDNGSDKYGFNAYWKDYCSLDIVTNNKGDYIIEIRAELEYRDLIKLAEELDKVVFKYDKDAYFDIEEPGILTCYLSKNIIKKANNLNESREVNVGDRVKIINANKYHDGKHGKVEYKDDEIITVRLDNGLAFNYDYIQVIKESKKN